MKKNSLTTLATTEKKINQGFTTESNHFEQLKLIFGANNVSEPKNSGGGSDFIVMHNDKIISFESKTSNTDVYDAGVVNIFSNSYIYNASCFLTNNHINQIETWIQKDIQQVIDYTLAANTQVIPHSIHRDLYNEIKADKKLIHIIAKESLDNIVEESFTKSKNKFVKANYVIIGDNIFRISMKPELDPLNLQAPVLDSEDIAMTSIRTARSGSRPDGMSSVTLRTQFRMNKELKPTPYKLSLLGDSINRQ